MRNKQFNRRDFLKLMGLIPATIAVKPLSTLAQGSVQPQPHIIVLVYDAWSARNTSLYGYARNTMPNLGKFAEKSVVYHRHYAPANFTVPGTASLLTGVYPWKHRAFEIGGRIASEYQKKQVFNALEDKYKNVGYAQNKYADLFLFQAGDVFSKHITNHEFNLSRRLAYSLPTFNNDSYVAYSSLDEIIFQKDLGYDGSLLLGPVVRTMTLRNHLLDQIRLSGRYSNDLLPETTEQFLLKDVVDGAIGIMNNLTEPSMVYIHFFPPHSPYRPKNKFLELFSKSPDTLINKPIHPLSTEKVNYKLLNVMNNTYDAYLATWDAEVERLYQFIDSSGLRQNSYIFITSDHGEMFERGEAKHSTPLLNEPVVHIPLVVSYPGNNARKDVHAATSAVDLLPTIANIAGISKPAWADGELLPEFGGQYLPNRSVYSLEAKKNAAFLPLTEFSLSLTKNNKRLLYYQYGKDRITEFYDLDQDPEEMTNIFSTQTVEVKEMSNELMQKVSEITVPFNK